MKSLKVIIGIFKRFKTKIILSIMCFLIVLSVFSGCTKKDEQIALCLNASDLQGAITVAEEADKKSITKAETEIKTALISMLNNELKTIQNDFSDTDYYLVNSDIISKFKKYKELKDLLNYEWENSNAERFIEDICSLEEYTKYNKVCCAIAKANDYMHSMNNWLEQGTNSLFYTDVCLDKAITQSVLAESAFASRDDEYMKIGYNYCSENTKILKKIQSEGQQEDTTNKFGDEFTQMTSECAEAANTVTEVIKNLPTSIY